MKIKPQNFIVPLGVYPFDVMVSVGENDETLFRHLKKCGIENGKELEGAMYEELGLGLCCSFSSGQFLIRIKNKPISPKEYGSLQHEIFHVVSILMNKVGMKLEISVSDEAYAYLTGYLTKEIYSKL